MASDLSDLGSSAVSLVSSGFSVLLKNWVHLGVAMLLTLQGIEFYSESATQFKESAKNMKSLSEQLAGSGLVLDDTIKEIESSGENLHALPQAITTISSNISQMNDRIATMSSNIQSQISNFDQHLGLQDQRQIALSKDLLNIQTEMSRTQVNLEGIAKDMHAAAVYAVLFKDTNDTLIGAIEAFTDTNNQPLVEEKLARFKKVKKLLAQNQH